MFKMRKIRKGDGLMDNHRYNFSWPECVAFCTIIISVFGLMGWLAWLAFH